MVHEGPEVAAVAILCIALAAGAATRLIAQRVRIPYTVAMLLLGMAFGLVLPRLDAHTPLLDPLAASVVSPELILFVFLPALVFESAFALDVHAFLKDMGLVALLAVPALVLTALAVGAWTVWITAAGWAWSWPAALVFGALISATDPVAVVAILREVGAPKRLGVLIEGESLLNDGTAIVVFSVLVGLLGKGAADFALAPTLVELARVVAGGVLVGLVLGAVCAAWIGRTFEDPLVEITLTLVLSYAAMLVAEHTLHVSGVLAIVTAGVYLAGPGRTRISPKVAHFLHEFWEMLAYVANTIIFFLVGAIVAANLDHASLSSLWTIAALYVGAMAIRFLVTFASRAVANPLMGLKLEASEATAMAWGGLRGAVSLALALVVSQREDVDPVLRGQILEVTAGVVLLTLLVNATSMRWLLARLGFAQVGAAEQLARVQTDTQVLTRVASAVATARERPGLRTVPWDGVEHELAQRREALERDLSAASDRLQQAGARARQAALWRQVYAIERRRYRRNFAAGTLGAGALEMLEHELDAALDSVDLGDLRPPERFQMSSMGRWVERAMRGLGFGFGRLAFSQLALRYDIARAHVEATRDVRDFLRHQGVEASTEVDDVYQRWSVEAMEQLEDLRVNLPEVAAAIESRLARRIALNFEQAAYRDVANEGQVSPDVAEHGLADVRARMKRLHFSGTHTNLPDTVALCAATPLFSTMSPQVLQSIAAITVEQVLAPGEWLFHEAERGDALYIVARGVLTVVREASDGADHELIAAIGGGEIIGEMALLTGAGRNAGARAVTSVTVGRIARPDYLELVKEHPEIGDQVWDAFGRRALDNYLRAEDDRLTAAERRALVHNARAVRYDDGAQVHLSDGALFVVKGEVVIDGLSHGHGEMVVGSGRVGGPTWGLLVPQQSGRRLASA